MEPRVSVVIPVRNRRYELVRAVLSAAGQTYPDVEIVVVDDASTDSVPDAVLSDAAAAAGRPIRILRSPQRVGACAARNLGIAAATGEYVAFLDSDDLWHPDKLARQMTAVRFSAAGRAALSYTGRLRIRGDWVEALQPATMTDAGRWRPAPANTIGPLSSVLAPRGLLRSVGGFAPELPASQDWDLFMRIQPHTMPVRIADPLLYFLVGKADRISASARRRLKGHLAIRRKFFRAVPADDAGDLYRKIARDLLLQRRWRAFAVCCRSRRPGLGAGGALLLGAAELAAAAVLGGATRLSRRLTVLREADYIHPYLDDFHRQEEAARAFWAAGRGA